MDVLLQCWEMKNQKQNPARHQFLMPIIITTQKAEIRRIAVGSQPGKIFRETLSQKTLHKNRAGEGAQGEGPEFKSQYLKTKTKTEHILPCTILL
jgi:hypothetical protein